MGYKPSHGDKREAAALLGLALQARGWKLYGWKEDRSDSMTDYYEPQAWDGVAELGGALACVDVGEYHVKTRSGTDERRVAYDVGATCDRCAGTGDEPDGWTLERARANPREFNVSKMLRANPGSSPIVGGNILGCGVTLADGARLLCMFADAVSPIGFDGETESCTKCHGLLAERTRREYVAFTWPTFQANPRGSSWHVEIGGRIVAKGAGVFSALESDGWESMSERDTRRRVSFGELADRITAAARQAIEPRAGATVAAVGDGVACVTVPAASTNEDGATVRASSFAGNVEILFPSKPAAEIREELKAAGFRWSSMNGCWYGKASRLPVRYSAPVLS